MSSDSQHGGEGAAPREALERHIEGGIVGYVQRIRADHSPMFEPSLQDGRTFYAGCRCGTVGCPYPYWLAHVDDLRAAYQGKCGDLAQETQRTTALLDVIRRVVETSRPGTTAEERNYAWKLAGAAIAVDERRQDEDFMARMARVRKQQIVGPTGGEG